MKQFFSRILLFIIPIILALIFTILYYLNNKRRVEFKLKEIEKFECIILGDSQMQKIDPKEFTDDTYNFASVGEHYYFTYQKLKKITKSKKHNIKKVILGVSIHNFSPVYNRLFDLDFSEGQKSLSKYLYFIDLNEQKFVKDKKKLLNKNLINGIYSNSNLGWGGFYKSNNENPDSLIIRKTLKMHYSITSSEKKTSSDQIKYLHQIDSLCKSNNITLFLVSTPYHPYYIKNIDPYYFKKFKKVLGEMNDVKHINYLDYQIDPFFMSDGNHLNYKGSKIFSKKINEMLNAENLSKKIIKKEN